MKTRVALTAAALGLAIAGLPPIAVAQTGHSILGGGAGSLGVDVDGDADIDGSYFGIGVELQDETTSGHFIYGMWGNTDVDELPVMGLEGQITGAGPTTASGRTFFTGAGTLDLGDGGNEAMSEVPFEVLVTPGGPGQGSYQLTIIGALDGQLGDTDPGNDNCELPPQEIASGQITHQPVTPIEAVDPQARHAIGGGGLSSFGADLDDDGDIDGAYFGLGIDEHSGDVTGHFVCAMWGDTEYWGLPLMALEGVVESLSIGANAGDAFTFAGLGTVDLGSDDGFFSDVAFTVVAKAGGPGVGTVQLTIHGLLDGVPGDRVLGNHDCDLPTETIASGFIALHEPPITLTAVVEEPSISTPRRFALEDNVPNPFNPSTTIRFSLPHHGQVVLRVLNGVGQEVETLIDQELAPGNYRTEWIPAASVSSGLYYYRLESGRSVETRKMLFLK